MIAVDGLTMKYRNGKGIFDLSFSIKEGEVFGYLGPNGAGKTTTIRNLLGFVKANQGSCSVNDLDCWSRAAEIQRNLGYIPGEIAFFNNMKGNEFLKLISDMRATKDIVRQSKLAEWFEIDTNISIRKMSKGMKQKVGIIAAFMHDPAVYILDEPTNGLDPLMQKKFVELILEEKKRGKTILMSSHVFDEIDRTCDRAGIIRDGKLVAVEDIHALKQTQQKKYLVTLESLKDAETLKHMGLNIVASNQNRMEIIVSGKVDSFIKLLSTVNVESIDVSALSLEEVFMQFYGQEAK